MAGLGHSDAEVRPEEEDLAWGPGKEGGEKPIEGRREMEGEREREREGRGER